MRGNCINFSPKFFIVFFKHYATKIDNKFIRIVKICDFWDWILVVSGLD